MVVTIWGFLKEDALFGFCAGYDREFQNSMVQTPGWNWIRAKTQLQIKALEVGNHVWSCSVLWLLSNLKFLMICLLEVYHSNKIKDVRYRFVHMFMELFFFWMTCTVGLTWDACLSTGEGGGKGINKNFRWWKNQLPDYFNPWFKALKVQQYLTMRFILANCWYQLESGDWQIGLSADLFERDGEGCWEVGL